MSNPIFDAALEALARGWSVMPTNREKMPLVKWKGYQSDFPTEEKLKVWFERHPERNLGLITGALSGCIVLEADSQEALDVAVSRGLPHGPVAQSSQPYKRHFYFKHPGFTVPNSTSKIYTKLDVRGDGGYAQLPPSIHKTGATYKWIVSPDEVEMPDAPEWFLEAVKRTPFVPSEVPVAVLNLSEISDAQQKYAAAAFNGELQKVAMAPDGAKHAQLYKSVAAVAEFIPHGFFSEAEVENAFYDAIAGRSENKENARKTIRDAIKKGSQQPRKMPEPSAQSAPRVVLRGRQARAFIDGATEQEAENMDPDPDETESEDWRTGPYGIADGRLVYIYEKTVKGEITTTVQVIANLNAKIAREITTEHGERLFVLKGTGGRGRHFEIELTAQQIADEKLLKTELIKAAGAKSTIAAGMAKHLYPAIDTLTGRIEQSTRFDRTGWASLPKGDIFLMPGREGRLPEFSSINLQGGMCYSIREGADLEKGLQALRHLLKSQLTSLLCIELAAMLQGPLNAPAGWRNERYGVFVTGRTNSFKTSTSQVMLCLYGPDFLDDRNLLRWDGTPNAIMKMAVYAHDMPLLVDNYKPNVGKDAAAKCIGLIQTIVEGSEKARMNRDRSLSDRAAIYAMPFITGEDVPETDAASLARILVLRLPQRDSINPELTKAQQLSHDLCAVGDAWLSWLESDHGQEVAKNLGAQFLNRRGIWSNYLRGIRSDMQGVPRIATNLATNELTWEIMSHCPALKNICEEFGKEHESGLKAVARDMSAQTADALEAHRYLDALRQLIATKRFVLAERLGHEADVMDRDRLLGWQDDDGVYLLPDLAYRAASDLLRDSGGLNNFSKNTLHKQLDSIGVLANKGDGGATIPKRCGDKLQRVLHLTPEALNERE